MATSANPAFQNLTPTTQVSLHSGLKVAQAAGMLAPPLYIVACLARKRPLSVNGVMRNAAVSVLAGGAVGTGIGYARLMNQPEDKIVDRAQRLKVNRGQIRTDDYSIIGAAVGALAGPAIFLRRAPTVTLVLGGAAIGLGAGVWTHIVQSFTKGEDIKPEQMIQELPGQK